jgi:hypothetical protein
LLAPFDADGKDDRHPDQGADGRDEHLVVAQVHLQAADPLGARTGPLIRDFKELKLRVAARTVHGPLL